MTAKTQRPLLTLTIQDVNKEQQAQLDLEVFLQKEVMQPHYGSVMDQQVETA